MSSVLDLEFVSESFGGGFEIVQGTDGADIIKGGDAAEVIDGCGGDDTIHGGKGGDIFVLDPGSEVVIGDLDVSEGDVVVIGGVSDNADISFKNNQIHVDGVTVAFVNDDSGLDASDIEIF